MHSSFEVAVGTGPLAKLMTLWRRESARHGGGVPPKSALAPEHLGNALLPHLFVYERRLAPDGRTRFFCRVAGGELLSVFKVEGTGRYLDELIPPEWLDDRTAVFSRCIDSGRPLIVTGNLVARGLEWKSYRRLLTPVRAKGGDVQILGAIEFPNGSVAAGRHDIPAEDGKCHVVDVPVEEVLSVTDCAGPGTRP